MTTASELYHGAVGTCLTGYQLLEEQLKGYLEIHYDITRMLLSGRLHFAFQGADVAKAPLERLILLFAKTCGNEELIGELRRLIDHRNEIAHRAYLVMYNAAPDDAEFIRLATEVNERSAQVGKLLERVNGEMGKLTAALAAPRGT